MVKENAGDATRFRGVRKLKSGNYGAEISIKSKTKWLGTFKTAEEAARRYDAAAHELHGVKAKLNFPHELLAESEVYPTRVNKTSTASEESSSNPNMNGCSRQNNSGRANDMIVVDQSPAGSNLDSSLQIVDFEPTKSLENAEEKITKLVEEEDYQTLEVGELIPNSEKFKVIVNGYNISSALGDDIRDKYFDLCLSQGSYLHARLAKVISSKLAVEIISVVTETSEWIRNCNLVSNLAEFEERRSVLKGFELFGMNLGFLINRLDTIYGIIFESTMEVDLEKCKNAKTEHVRTEEKKNELGLKLLELEKEMVEVEKKKMKLYYEIETIEGIANKYEGKIRKEATAPW